MQIIIVRHGETDYNLQGRLQGCSDIPLNATGRAQAKKVAHRLRKHQIHTFIASPLKRALHTGQTIAAHHDSQIPFHLEPAIQEVSFGEDEGLTWEQISQKYPKPFSSAQEQFLNQPPGGESLKERVDRLKPLIALWKKRYHGQTLLLATHGYIKKGILIALGATTFPKIENTRFNNTAISIIHPLEKDPIKLFNESSHLELV